MFLHVVFLQPVSIITPFMQGNSRNFNVSTKSLLPSTQLPLYPPLWTYNNYKPRSVQRHQSFHGFGNNIQPFFIPQTNNNLVRFQPRIPSVLYNLPSNLIGNNTVGAIRTATSGNHLNFPINRPQSVSTLTSQLPCQKGRIIGRKEQMQKQQQQQQQQQMQKENIDASAILNVNESNSSIQNANENSANTLKSTQIANVNEKRFGSLELKKHKCYSPTFYSMRCKKHAKRRPLIYAVPKKFKSSADTKSSNENIKPKGEIFVFKGDQNETFQNLTDSIQIMEQNTENNAKQDSTKENTPKPAPRCKRHRKNSCHVYENVSFLKNEGENLDSSENGSGVEVSVTTKALVHNSDDTRPTETTTNHSNFKRSPTVRVVPSVIKPKTVSPKGALNLQLQAKIKSRSQTSLDKPENPSPKNDENFLVPQMPLLDTQNKWMPKLSLAKQVCSVYFFYFYFCLRKLKVINIT